MGSRGMVCIALALAFTTGCSKSEEKKPKQAPAGGGEGGKGAEPAKLAGSCDTRTKNDQCAEFGGGAEYAEQVRSDCTQGYGGTYIDGPCPAEGIVGRCVNSDGYGVANVFYAPKTEELVKAYCGTVMKFEPH